MLTNLCLDRKRRPQPVELEAAGEIPDSGDDGFSRTERGEQGRRVAEAMAKLPERQRAALALCYYEDMGNIEAAKALDISVGALESLLVRGRRALARQSRRSGERGSGGMMMGLDRFRELMDAYGAEPARWPANERAGGRSLAGGQCRSRACCASVPPRSMRYWIRRRPGAGHRRRAADRIHYHPAAAYRRIVQLRPARRASPGAFWLKVASLAAAATIGFLVGVTQLANFGDTHNLFSGLELADVSPW